MPSTFRHFQRGGSLQPDRLGSAKSKTSMCRLCLQSEKREFAGARVRRTVRQTLRRFCVGERPLKSRTCGGSVTEFQPHFMRRRTEADGAGPRPRPRRRRRSPKMPLCNFALDTVYLTRCIVSPPRRVPFGSILPHDHSHPPVRRAQRRGDRKGGAGGRGGRGVGVGAG
jgi:hypothetical protein